MWTAGKAEIILKKFPYWNHMKLRVSYKVEKVIKDQVIKDQH